MSSPVKNESSELSVIEKEWKESEYAIYQYTPNRWAKSLNLLVIEPDQILVFCNTEKH